MFPIYWHWAIWKIINYKKFSCYGVKNDPPFDIFIIINVTFKKYIYFANNLKMLNCIYFLDGFSIINLFRNHNSMFWYLNHKIINSWIFHMGLILTPYYIFKIFYFSYLLELIYIIFSMKYAFHDHSKIVIKFKVYLIF